MKTKNELTLLEGLVTSKIEDGNVKATLRLLSSEDKSAKNDETTVNALRAKYHVVTLPQPRPSLPVQSRTAGTHLWFQTLAS